jgi:hypothetical protein
LIVGRRIEVEFDPDSEQPTIDSDKSWNFEENSIEESSGLILDLHLRFVEGEEGEKDRVVRELDDRPLEGGSDLDRLKPLMILDLLVYQSTVVEPELFLFGWTVQTL